MGGRPPTRPGENPPPLGKGPPVRRYLERRPDGRGVHLSYAEARGLLPIANPGYREQSLTALAQWAAERLDKGLPLSDALHATPKYHALLDLLRRIDQGDLSLGIPRYNGGLFSPAGLYTDPGRPAPPAPGKAVPPGHW
ncbi:MAG: hypothetical protein ACK4WK_00245 [Anaerolineae bacterium]